MVGKIKWIIFHDSRKLCEIQVLISVDKVLLKDSHAHTLHMAAFVLQWQSSCDSPSRKYLLSGFYRKGLPTPELVLILKSFVHSESRWAFWATWQSPRITGAEMNKRIRGDFVWATQRWPNSVTNDQFRKNESILLLSLKMKRMSLNFIRKNIYSYWKYFQSIAYWLEEFQLKNQCSLQPLKCS